MEDRFNKQSDTDFLKKVPHLDILSQITLGILDQCPLREGLSVKSALEETEELAELAQSLGYKRFWVSEHHDRKRFGIRCPEIAVTRILSRTDLIGGVGGFMVYNQNPIKIAETIAEIWFQFEKRVEFGFGSSIAGRKDEVEPLRSYLKVDSSFGYGEFIHQVRKHLIHLGASDSLTSLFGLSTSTSSAQNIASLDLSMAFGYFINPKQVLRACGLYDSLIKNAHPIKAPKRVLALSCIVCDDSKEMAKLIKHHVIHKKMLSENPDSPVPCADVIKNTFFDLAQRKKIAEELNGSAELIGTALEVSSSIHKIAESTGWTDFVVTMYGYDKCARFEMYQQLMAGFEQYQKNAKLVSSHREHLNRERRIEP